MLDTDQAHTHHFSPQSHQQMGKVIQLDPKVLRPNDSSIKIYGDPTSTIDDLRESVKQHGILVPLVVTPITGGVWLILSGHRRWSCALSLQLAQVPCEVRYTSSLTTQQCLILEYNRQRKKTFTQLMHEADLLEQILKQRVSSRRLLNSTHNVHGHSPHLTNVDCRNSDTQVNLPEHTGSQHLMQAGRRDVLIAQHLGMGGKDLYRQARAIWQKACTGDTRAKASIALLDTGQKTVYAAYKDLRRRTQFTTNFTPTPYDVWTFHHDRAFGIPHPGSTPPKIIAHTIHYFTPLGGLVVDPMAGGGTVIDVCQSMGRLCIAYDLVPMRADIQRHDIRDGFPDEARNCDLVFCDPPYHTMLATSYPPEGISSMSLQEWLVFLRNLAQNALKVLRQGGVMALLLAPQTEKDIPPGFGYVDHTFLGYLAALEAGFIPERRISCPMSGGYLPQQIRQARIENRLLGQVRDLLILRKAAVSQNQTKAAMPDLQVLISDTSRTGNRINPSN